MGDELKIWLAVRSDLPWVLGKLAAQAAHAFVGVSLLAVKQSENWMPYKNSAMPKIAVSVPDESSLLKVRDVAQEHGLLHYLVMDAGRTVFSEPTYTVCAFGPYLKSGLPSYLKRLRLYEG